jgi:hypothetical protein
VLKLESLAKLKEILEAFRILSGLSCNVEKTSVMRIGNLEGEVDPEIVNLGFSFVDKMVLLGFTLSNNENLEEINFLPVLEKSQNTVRFWERFYLSLPGKISVYKCLLLSQISYKASILMPPPNVLRAIEDTMERFVLKGFTFAQDRLYRKIKDGGLGLIKLEHYVQALHCTWIRRAWSCTNDNWKFDLYQASNGNILNIREHGLRIELGTVLSNLVKSYNNFQNKFTTVGNNFTLVPVYENPNFGYGRRQSIKIDSIFFGADLMDRHSQNIRELTWDKCTVYGNLVPLREFHIATGIPISRRCIFCIMENREIIGTESFEHIFYSCPTTNSIVSKMFEKFFTVNLNPQIFFSGEAVPGNENENAPFNLTLDVIRFFIWQCKLNKKKPTMSSIVAEVQYCINVIRKTSEELSDLFQNCSLFKHDDGDEREDGGHGRG